MARSTQTRNHDEIRRWAEEHGGIPTRVKGTGGLLRIDFVEGPESHGREQSLEQIGWDDWFRTFDEMNLVFLHGEGDSKFFKLVYPQTLERKSRRRGAARSSRPASARKSSRRATASRRGRSARKGGRRSAAGARGGSRGSRRGASRGSRSGASRASRRGASRGSPIGRSRSASSRGGSSRSGGRRGARRGNAAAARTSRSRGESTRGSKSRSARSTGAGREEVCLTL